MLFPLLVMALLPRLYRRLIWYKARLHLLYLKNALYLANVLIRKFSDGSTTPHY